MNFSCMLHIWSRKWSKLILEEGGMSMTMIFLAAVLLSIVGGAMFRFMVREDLVAAEVRLTRRLNHGGIK